MIDATRGLIGSTIKHYRIESLLGEGGMGAVYKAHDTVLGRTLALKILPSRFVADPDRRARFIQEAKSASALNHPHVVTIYEIGDAHLPGGGDGAGIHYIAMELVDGVTLRDKMIAGRLELKKALECIAQAADGLSGAHAAGVVHRDLKPENIMVSSSGYVKILDFGLAKLREGATVAEMGNSVTAIKKTDPGVVLGTVGYMSPEQAAGRPVDQRSDIFSLGCILYETVTTRRPFVGESSVDTLHKILYSEPVSIRDLNPELPSELQRILRKCLAKDPEERYQSAKDLTIDLRDLKRELESQPQLSGAIAAPQVRRPASAWIWFGVVGLVVIAIALAAILLHHRAGRARAAPTAPMKITRITTSGLVIAAAISPDANYIAYVHSDAGQHGLWLRQVATGSTLQLIPPRRVGFWGHRFAPDGNSIYYNIKGPEDPSGTLYQIPTIGGESRKILRNIETPVTFSPDAKRLAFVRTSFPKEGESSLLVANLDGTQETLLLTKRPPEYLAPIFFCAPAWSHDGTRIALPLRIRNDQAKLISVDVATRKETTLSSGPWTHVGEVAWLPEDRGLLLIASTGMGQIREAQLWYVNSHDGKHRQITNDLFAYRITSLSADGKSLVTVASDTTADVWVTSLQGESPRKITKGKYEGLQAITSGPDGSIIYNSVGSSPDGDLWVTDHTGEKARQLTSDDGPNADAVITPDGRFIVWVGIREGDWTLLRMNRDGSDVRQLCTLRPVDSPSITPDSQWVFFSAAPTGIWTLWKVPIDGGEPVQLTTYPTLGPSVSPDGQHIAAMVRPSPDRGLTLVTIPIEGGRPTREFQAFGTNFSMVRWSPDGRGLIHNAGLNDRINLWFQPLEGGPPRRITNFDDQYVLRFDVSADGKHLLVVRGVLSRDAVLITNFPTSAEQSR